MPWSSQPICDGCYGMLAPLQTPVRLRDVEGAPGDFYSEPCWVCREPTRGIYFRARQCDACDHGVHNYDLVNLICRCCRLPAELGGRRLAVQRASGHHSSEP